MNSFLINALLVSASGVLTVFLVLALISGLVVVISKVLNALGGKKATAVVTPSAPPVAVAPAVSYGDVALLDVDEKTAACIMALVSHETKIPLNQLIFKQIKGI